MKLAEIAEMPVDTDMSADTKRVRRNAPKYIRSVIEDSRAVPDINSIDELRQEQVDRLGGGVDAATYLLTTPQVKVIIKLSYSGIEAEVEALQAWRKRHVRVPAVISSGIVPITKGDQRPVKYMVQEALLDRHGRLVETCASYLVHSPKQAREIGRLLGAELNKLHRAVATRSFGDYADAAGNTAAYASWNAYLLDYLQVHVDYLGELKIDDEKIEAVKHFIAVHKFVSRGRYLHGDFSIRNAAVKPYGRMRVSLFDPNPLIGDPSWDIAVLFNNYEFHKRRCEYDDSHRELYVRDQQLLIGFKQGYRRQINQGSLLVAQLIQAILQARYVEDSERKDDPLDLRVRQEFVYRLVETLSKQEP